MKYTEIDLQCEDIMWFGVDRNGLIFECTSAGIGCVPSFVCDSREETEALMSFFLSDLQATTCGALLFDVSDNQLTQDCLALTSKGIFCFDVAVDENRPNEYKKIAFPKEPVKVCDLPENIQTILKTHKVEVDVTTESYITVPHAYGANVNIEEYSYLWTTRKEAYVLVNSKHGYGIVNKIDHTVLLVEDDALEDALVQEMFNEGCKVYQDILEAYSDVGNE